MPMDEKQADAVARLILESGLNAQHNLRNPRENESPHRVVQRRTGAFVITGMVGAAMFRSFGFGLLACSLVIGGIAALLLLVLLVKNVLSDNSSTRTSGKPRAD